MAEFIAHSHHHHHHHHRSPEREKENEEEAVGQGRDVFLHRRQFGGDFRQHSFLRSSSSLHKWSKTKSSKDITIGNLHLYLRYGEHTIQGHRATQEDAHTATTDLARRRAEEDRIAGRKRTEPVPEPAPAPEFALALAEQVAQVELGTGEHSGSTAAFFGVYDGHGGRACSDFLAQHLHRFFSDARASFASPSAALARAFERAEAEWLAKARLEDCIDGSTACVAVIEADELTVGNVGDAEAVLCRGGRAVNLTQVHNPARNAAEAERVRNAGGVLRGLRVCHPVILLNSLAVSRAIGDLPYKSALCTNRRNSGVTAEPYIKTVRLLPEDEFIILGCDGVWDVISQEEAVTFCANRLAVTDNPQQVAEELVEKAFADGSYDNISALVVTFKSFSSPTSEGPAEADRN